MALTSAGHLTKVILANEGSENVDVGRELTRYLRKLGIEHARCRDVVHAYKRLRNPSVMKDRARLASDLAVDRAVSDQLETRGYVTLPPGHAPGTEKITELLRSLWQARCQGAAPHPDMDWVGGTKKEFLRNCLLPGDFEERPEIADWFLQDAILGLAAKYFGHVPMLGGVRLWWSPVNNTQESSQMFHLDYEDRRMLRVFLNVTDVTEKSGPFTFFPATDSRKVTGRFGTKFDRLTDEEVFSTVDPSKLVRLVGPAGSVHFVDPARCVHYGSRGCDTDRLIFMVHYNPVPVHIEPTGWIPRLDKARYRDSELARLALPIRFNSGGGKYSAKRKAAS